MLGCRLAPLVFPLWEDIKTTNHLKISFAD